MRSTARQLLAAVTGAAGLALSPLASPGSAQTSGSCPPSVDTRAEGWICEQLLLATPTTSPSDQQIGFWEGVLNEEGRVAVAGGIVFSDASTEAKVEAIYRSELGRAPDEGAVEYWADVIEDARTELAAEFAIFDSGEYLSQFESTEAFVDDQYRYYLGRDASQEEQSYWADRLRTDDVSNQGITRAIATSQEAGAVRADRLYDDYLRRDADPSGFEHWMAHAAAVGHYRAAVDIAVSDEAFVTLGSAGCAAAGTEC